MKLPSPTEFNLLMALGAQEMSGRDLARRYESEQKRSISYGTLYTAMRRLKDSGWVTVRDDEDEDGRVRFFKLTGSGIDKLPSLRDLASGFGWKGVEA
jgi:DNA-binding PadR family transcriptional regulator